ncbi:MAG: sterol desaturase family protein [Myxococcales bacterium]|nr:sterol desaturase family protein [Myxococcales bacterium]
MTLSVAAPAVSPGMSRPKKSGPSPSKLSSAPGGSISLLQAWKTFLAHPNAWLLITALIGTATMRVITGDFTPWDALIVVALVAFHPFQEWLIHVYVLHWQPRKWGPLTIDFELAKRHRHHHVDPWDMPTVFIPKRTLWFAVIAHSVGWLAIMPTQGLAWTGLVTVTMIGLVYEFTHYIVHTTYKPKSKTYKRIFRYHRLHHFKNEHFWYGVTMHQGDRVLGTLPKHQRDVPTSPTARNIGGVAAGDCDV